MNKSYALFVIVLLYLFKIKKKNVCFEFIPMAVNHIRYSRIEWRSVSEYLMGEKCKSCNVFKECIM